MRIHAAVVIGLVCVAAVAHAQQPSKEFTEEYQAGIDAYRLGKYDEAKTHLEKAKKLDATLPGPWRWLAAIAQTEGQWPECVASSREALRLNPQSKEAPATRKIHDDCRSAWGKPAFTDALDPGQGALAVTTDQVGALVEVNGLKYGSTPMAPRAFASGDAEISVEKTGYLKQSRKVVILEGIVTDVDFVLEVDPEAGGTDIIPPTELEHGWIKVVTKAPGAVIRIDAKELQLDAQGRYQVEPGPHEVTVTAPDHEGMTKKVRVTKGQMITVDAPLRSQATVDATRTKGKIVFGTGVGLLAVGFATALISSAAADQARDWHEIEASRPPIGDTSAVPLHSRAEIEDLVDRSKTLGLVSNIAYGAGVIAIGIGAYFFVKGRPAGDKPTITLVPTVGGATAVGEVRW